MGRKKGGKNAPGHSAGGARKGAGRPRKDGTRAHAKDEPFDPVFLSNDLDEVDDDIEEQEDDVESEDEESSPELVSKTDIHPAFLPFLNWPHHLPLQVVSTGQAPAPPKPQTETQRPQQRERSHSQPIQSYHHKYPQPGNLEERYREETLESESPPESYQQRAALQNDFRQEEPPSVGHPLSQGSHIHSQTDPSAIQSGSQTRHYQQPQLQHQSSSPSRFTHPQQYPSYLRNEYQHYSPHVHPQEIATPLHQGSELADGHDGQDTPFSPTRTLNAEAHHYPSPITPHVSMQPLSSPAYAQSPLPTPPTSTTQVSAMSSNNFRQPVSAVLQPSTRPPEVQGAQSQPVPASFYPIPSASDQSSSSREVTMQQHNQGPALSQHSSYHGHLSTESHPVNQASSEPQPRYTIQQQQSIGFGPHPHSPSIHHNIPQHRPTPQRPSHTHLLQPLAASAPSEMPQATMTQTAPVRASLALGIDFEGINNPGYPPSMLHHNAASQPRTQTSSHVLHRVPEPPPPEPAPVHSPAVNLRPLALGNPPSHSIAVPHHLVHRAQQSPNSPNQPSVTLPRSLPSGGSLQSYLSQPQPSVAPNDLTPLRLHVSTEAVLPTHVSPLSLHYTHPSNLAVNRVQPGSSSSPMLAPISSHSFGLREHPGPPQDERALESRPDTASSVHQQPAALMNQSQPSHGWLPQPRTYQERSPLGHSHSQSLPHVSQQGVLNTSSMSGSTASGRHVEANATNYPPQKSILFDSLGLESSMDHSLAPHRQMLHQHMPSNTSLPPSDFYQAIAPETIIPTPTPSALLQNYHPASPMPRRLSPPPPSYAPSRVTESESPVIPPPLSSADSSPRSPPCRTPPSAPPPSQGSPLLTVAPKPTNMKKRNKSQEPDSPYTKGDPNSRQRRRCAVCVQQNNFQQAVDCPGRGDRARCVSLNGGKLAEPRPYGLEPVDKVRGIDASGGEEEDVDMPSSSGDSAMMSYNQRSGEAASLPHGDDAGTSPASTDSPRMRDLGNLDSRVVILASGQSQKRKRRCAICVKSGKDGLECPGRGNRSLCPTSMVMNSTRNSPRP